MGGRFVFVISVFLSVAVFSEGVSADQIDGNWCRGLRHLYIDGPNIVTPGGTRMTGEYDRHGFRYVVPSGETGAGDTVVMWQVHDELMQMTVSSKPDQVEDWTRCQQKIS